MSLTALAQADTDSPYSRFGLGNLKNGAANTRLQAMGGLSVAATSNTLINANNPASYAMIDSLTFLFDANFYMKSARLTQNATANHKAIIESSANSSFDYAAIAFSITKWCKASVGIMPFSDINYSITTKTNSESSNFNPSIGNYNVLYEGSGGINKFYFGSGFNLGKHFAAGVNVSYLFGNNSNETTLYFPDSTYIFATNRKSEIMLSNFKLDYGLIYTGKIGKDLRLNLGATYTQPALFRSDRTLNIQSLYGGVGGTNIETIYADTSEITYSMPQGFGIGFTLAKNRRWIVGADFTWTGWEGFEMGGVNDSLQNAWRISAGGEYKPKSSSISGYLTKMSYRAGVHYEQTFINIDGKSIDGFGVSAGFSIPFPRSLSTLNMAVEVGQIGTESDELIRSNYIKLSVGMSIYDRWFVKRKYK